MFPRPRYKGGKFLTEEERIVITTHITSLTISSTMPVLNMELGEHQCEDSPPQLTSSCPPLGSQACTSIRTCEENEDADIFACLLGDLTQKNCEVKSDIETEIAMYLTHIVTDPDPLIWWRNNAPKFPELSKLARKYLAIPATEVSSERAFSTAGNIITKKRAALDPDTVDQIIFLNKNYKFKKSPMMLAKTTNSDVKVVEKAVVIDPALPTLFYDEDVEADGHEDEIIGADRIDLH